MKSHTPHILMGQHTAGALQAAAAAAAAAAVVVRVRVPNSIHQRLGAATSEG